MGPLADAAATVAAAILCGGWAWDAMTHPSFHKRSYRFVAVAVVLAFFVLILNAIWF